MRIFLILMLLAATASAGVIRQGVNSLAVSGTAQLKQDVTVTAGSNISLGQIGQFIYITATSTASQITATAKTANYDITSSDIYLSDVATSGVTFTLPSCVTLGGAKAFSIQNYSFYQLRVTTTATTSDVIITGGGNPTGDRYIDFTDYGTGANVVCYGGTTYYVH